MRVSEHIPAGHNHPWQEVSNILGFPCPHPRCPKYEGPEHRVPILEPLSFGRWDPGASFSKKVTRFQAQRWRSESGGMIWGWAKLPG
jgi:hypothetical protein